MAEKKDESRAETPEARAEARRADDGRKADEARKLADERAEREAQRVEAHREAVKSGLFVRLRFRRAVTLAGATHSGTEVATVEATDEAWDAVNRGDADLDPPPGTAMGDFVQPFPPAKLTESESPTPPMFAGTPAGAVSAGAGTTPGTRPAAADYSSMTVEDLHAEATRRNLEGRSELKTKEDLVKALKRHDAKR